MKTGLPAIAAFLTLAATVAASAADTPIRATSSPAISLMAEGKLAEAEAAFRKEIETLKKTKGTDSIETIGHLNTLVMLLGVQGRFGDALPLAKQSFAAVETIRGPDDPDTIYCLKSLATVYHNGRKLDEAEPLYRRLLKACENTRGPDHKDTREAVSLLGRLFQDKGEPATAEPFYRRALESSERTLGPDAEETIKHISPLAQVIEAQGDPARLDPLYRRGLAADEKRLGPQSPAVAAWSTWLGATLTRLNKLDEAEGHLRRSIAISTEARPLDILSIGFARWNLAKWCKASGRIDEAQREGEWALKLIVKSTSEDNSITRELKDWLASVVHRI